MTLLFFTPTYIVYITLLHYYVPVSSTYILSVYQSIYCLFKKKRR